MINSPFQLPCGTTLRNRLAKAATTERLSNRQGQPSEDLCHLYDRWADCDAGLLISGNVMCDASHMESAGNVIIANETVLPSLRRWTALARKNNHHFWAQISHSGRQTSRMVRWRPLAPSPVQLHKMGLFGKPKAMTEAQVEAVIEGFVRTAKLCREGGFTGVQIHAAHGYLLSQFLSPLTNLRQDRWGGSLENRSRLLRTIIRKCRAVLGVGFPISVKLNSADFQRGGFSEEESLAVVQMLEAEGIDLLEISGGTYEQLIFFLINGEEGKNARASTRRREAYFMDFANKVRQLSTLPIMITGGFRTYDFCQEVLQKGEVDVIGMARPFITNPHQIHAFLRGEVKDLADLSIRSGLHQLKDSAEGGFYARQIIDIARGKPVRMDYGALASALFLIKHELLKAMGKWRG
ncbi:MAG: NADH:flavin oxidoreductase/NADH oxidase family protein [Bacteroidota bacterium]